MTTLASTHSTVNGIDIGALQHAIDSIAEVSSRGATTWTIRSAWKGGTRTDHVVDGCMIGGKKIDRSFALSVDEPLELCGTNRYANPQEYLLAGLNACMMVGYSAVAALMGITLTKLEVETIGDIDLRGFLAIDAKVPAGYPNLKQTVRIAGNGTREQFEKLHATVQATSPNFYNITRAVPVKSALVVG